MRKIFSRSQEQNLKPENLNPSSNHLINSDKSLLVADDLNMLNTG